MNNTSIEEWHGRLELLRKMTNAARSIIQAEDYLSTLTKESDMALSAKHSFVATYERLLNEFEELHEFETITPEELNNDGHND